MTLLAYTPCDPPVPHFKYTPLIDDIYSSLFAKLEVGDEYTD